MWYLPAELDVAEPGLPHDGRFSGLDTAHIADGPAILDSSTLSTGAAIVGFRPRYALVEKGSLMFLPGLRAGKDEVVDASE